MKAFYIPPALRGILTPARATVAMLQDVSVLLSTLSEEDVAFYLRLQISPAVAMPVEIADSFEWLRVTDALATPRARSSDQETFLLHLDGVERYMREWDAAESLPSLGTAEMVLTCDLWDEETVVFTHVPAPKEALENETTSLTDLNDQIYDRLIQQLYGFMPFEQLSSMALFNGYLRKAQRAIKSA